MDNIELKKFATKCAYYISDSDFCQRLARQITNADFATFLDETIEKLQKIFLLVSNKDKEVINNNLLSFYNQFLDDDDLNV